MLNPRRRRRLFWDLVTLLAAGGLIYGAFELIDARGLLKGAGIAVAMAVCGYLALLVIYPLWFPHDRR